MFVAHIPAGYLVARSLERRARPDTRRSVFLGVLVGSVLPDLDLLYAYGVDDGRVHHHVYPTHLPLTWLALLALCALLRTKHASIATLAAVARGALLHVVLDTFVGDIRWAWPLSDRFFHVVTVEPTEAHWILSFVLHWTFAIELALCACALFVFLRRANGALDRHATMPRSVWVNDVAPDLDARSRNP